MLTWMFTSNPQKPVQAAPLTLCSSVWGFMWVMVHLTFLRVLSLSHNPLPALGPPGGSLGQGEEWFLKDSSLP